MTKSNELLECMSFSHMKQIQNRVFGVSLVVHVKIGLIIHLHIILSYSSLCICLTLLTCAKLKEKMEFPA